MKTLSTVIQQDKRTLTSLATRLLPVMDTSLRTFLAMLAAGVAVTAIITLSIWAAGMDVNAYAGAFSWGLGFIFLALAVDNRGKLALVQMVSGLLILLMALLQRSISPDFIIGSGVLVAAWVGIVLFQRLSR